MRMVDVALRRTIRPYQCSERPRIMVEGRDCLDFSSNDYLGLRFNSYLKNAYQKGIELYGIGSGGSPLVCGYDTLKQEVEQDFSRFLSKEKALLCNSGYVANLAVFSSIFAKQHTTFFLDKSCHASIYDALAFREQRYTTICRYPHVDFNMLEKKLASSKASNKVIITEGIFSMTGQQADLQRLAILKNNYQATLIVDDAHCIGLKGKYGQGSSAYVDSNAIDILICPLGKAFALQGAMVCAKNSDIEAIIQSARAYIYSTALGSGVVYALKQALELIQSSSELRHKLTQNIALFNSLKQNSKYNFLESYSAIQFLVTGCPEKAINLFEYLKQKNIFCYPMRYPTVAKQKTGLRFVLSAAHSKENLTQLFDALREYK